jgi:hypothetical protein
MRLRILRRYKRPRRLTRLRILRTFMRPMRARAGETGHVQIKVHRLSHGKPFQPSKEHDFIAVAASGKTLVMPEAILALKYRERRVLVVVSRKWATRAFRRVLPKSKHF